MVEQQEAAAWMRLAVPLSGSLWDKAGQTAVNSGARLVACCREPGVAAVAV